MQLPDFADQQELVRKARPPAVPPSGLSMDADNMLTCTATYDPGNLEPPYAILLPATLSGGRWRLVDAGGVAIEKPTVADIQSPFKPVSPYTGGTRPNAVEVTVPWPGTAPFALLLLLHRQAEDSGDPHWLVLKSKKILLLKAIVRCLDRSPDLERGVLRAPAAAPGAAAAAAATAGPGAHAFENLPGPAALAASATLSMVAPFSAGLASNKIDSSASDQSSTGDAPSAEGPEAEVVGFALASCQYPAGMLDAGIHPDGDFRPHDDGDIGPAEQSLWRMAKRFEADASLAFCVLTGDQIYVDATAGLFDANTLLDGLTVAYTGLTASRGMARLRLYARAQHPPEVVTLMDDHEVADNWEPLPASFGIPPDAKQQLIKTAKKRYLEYQRSNWPPPAHITGHPLFESRTLSGFEFFLADTRTERAGRWVGNWDIAEIMGPAQALALKQWIKTIANLDTPSFIVSPSILLPRLLCTQDRPPMALHADSWCGYPKSLYNVLASAYCANARRLVFLSGDEHLSCLARIEVSCSEEPGRVVTLHSIHSSALYAPFPFANAIEQDFAGSDKIEFTHTCDDGTERHFRCVVSTYFSAVGDGFALIRMSKESGEWCGNVKFDGQKGPTEELRFA